MSEIINGIPQVGGGVSNLSELSDVVIASPANLQRLAYDIATEKWKNKTPNLNDFGNVNIVTPGQGDFIRYNPSTGKFENYHLMETANRTINIDNTWTTQQIRDAIQEPLMGLIRYAEITIQFAPGTYTLDNSISFAHALGGAVNIQGNRNEANADVLHTTQEVFLDFSNAECNGIGIANCLALVNIYNLKIKVKAPASGNRGGVWVTDLSNVRLWNSYIYYNSDAYGEAVFASFGASLMCRNNYLGKSNSGLMADQSSHICSVNNDDVGGGNQPKNGLRAINGSVIAKNGTQPTGSVQNELTTTGGVIR